MKILFTLIFLLPIAAQAITFDELSLEEKGRVNKGEILIKVIDRPNASWPAVHMFTKLKVSAVEGLALFLALDIQKEYIPNLLASKPIKHITATEVYTEYEMKLPWPLSNSHYVHGSDFKKTPDGYRAYWYMVKSDSANSVNGFAHFKENGLLHYHSAVDPKSAIAPLLKGFMIDNVKETFEAIVNFIHNTKKSNPQRLQKYVDYINRSLKGEFVYKVK